MNEVPLTRVESAVVRELRKGDALTCTQLIIATGFSRMAIIDALNSTILRGVVGSRYIDGDKNEEFYARPDWP